MVTNVVEDRQQLLNVIGKRLRAIPDWAAVLAVLLVIAAVFWAILGLRINGVDEEWPIYQEFDKGLNTLTILNTLFAPQADRALLALPFEIGYRITPDSFLGLNLVAIVVFLLRGFSFYALLRRLRPANPRLAFVGAIMFLVYPASTGWFSLRFVAYHMAVAAFLSALYCLVVYWQTSSRWALVGMALGLLVCTGIVETAYPLILLAPLLLIWLDKKLSWRLLRVAVFWYSIPLVMSFYSVSVLLTKGATYQSNLVDQATATLPLLSKIGVYLSRLYFMYDHALRWAWLNTITGFQFGSQSLLIGSFVGLLVLCIILWRFRATVASRFYVPIITTIIGLVVIGLSILLYLPLLGYYQDTDRVYIFASIGAALCVVAFIEFVDNLLRRVPAASWVLTSVLTLLAILYNVQQCQRIRYFADQEQVVLSQMAQQVPQMKPGTVVVVLTDAPHASPGFWMYEYVPFSAAVRYLYRNLALEAYPCNLGWEAFYFNAPCHLEHNQVLITFPGDRVISFTGNRLVLFRYTAEQGLTLLTQWPSELENAPNEASTDSGDIVPYTPFTRIISADPLVTTRAATLFPDFPFVLRVPHDEGPTDQVNFQFSDHISYLPYTAEGWDIGPWSVSPDARLHLWLSPTQNYQITFHVQFVNPDLQKDFAILVNGQTIPLTAGSDPGGQFVAYNGTIPAAVVARNLADTALIFQLDRVLLPQSTQEWNLPEPTGFLLDSLQIRPAGS